MAVSIPFTADLTEVRAQLDRLIADARAKAVSLPFNGGGSFAGAGVGGFTGGPPTVAGVLGQTVTGGAAPLAAGGFFNASVAGLSAGVGGPGQAAQLLGFGSAGFIASNPIALGSGGAGLLPPSGGALGFAGGGGGFGGFVNIPGAGGFGGGRRGPSFSGTFAGRGFNRLVGAGFLLNEAGRIAEATRDYGMASILAGGDQRAQIEATMAYRESLIGSVPFVGRAVGYVQDPSGAQQAGIEATLRSADAIDAKTRLMKSTGDERLRLEGEATLAETRDPLRRAQETERLRNEENVRNIRDRGNQVSAADAAIVRNKSAELAASRPERAANLARSDKFTGWSAYDDALKSLEQQDSATISSILKDQAEARKRATAPLLDAEERRSKGETTEILRDDDFRHRDMRIHLAGEIAAAGFESANNPRAADRAMLVAGARAAINASKGRRDPLDEQYQIAELGRARIVAFDAQARREDELESESLEARSRINDALIGHRPLAARQIAIDEEASRRASRPNADLAGIERERVSAQRLAAQQDREERELRSMSLRGEGRSLDLILHDQPMGAKANDIASNARSQARQLDNRGDYENAGQVIKNAMLQEQVLKKQYLEQFKPAEIDLNFTALNGPRTGEDVGQTLKDIRDEMKGLRQDLAGGPVAGD